ncbi:hypothetical protein QA811_29465 [Streptomyces sp. B21-102]|uniref:hypothetical protein n=1 Tax=Streptomyces sp. B21-102 TaxID=3039416 RepID=UPI002FEEF8C5
MHGLPGADLEGGGRQVGGGVEVVVLAAMAVPGRMPVTAAATAVTAVVARAALRMPLLLLCRMLSSP